MTKVPMTAVEWADKYFYLPEGSSQISGKWITQPLQVVMLNCMGNDAVKEIYVQKPTRIGYTKMLCCALMYLSEHKRRSSVVYEPNDRLAKQFTLDEFDPVIRVVPVMQEALPSWQQTNEYNNVKKKVGAGFSIDILGADTPNNFRMMTKQVICGDEIDAWKINSGEGDNTRVMRERIRGAAFGKAIFGSTATTVGQSTLERLMGDADVVLQMHLPCPHCGEYQILEWGGKDTPFGMKWDRTLPKEQAAATAYYQCRHCEDPIYYSSLTKMQELGKWICSNTGTWTKNGIDFYNAEGRRTKAPQRIGFMISALYSLNLTEGWIELVREWLDISGDVDKLQAFWNLTLGLLWQPQHTKRISHQHLMDRRESYSAQVPDEVVILTGGIDTQDNRLEAYVWGFTWDMQKYLIARQIVMGDPRDDASKTKMEEICRRVYRKANGEELSVKKWCWDIGGHRTEVVYEMSKRIGILHVIPVRGANEYGQPIQRMPIKITKPAGVFLTAVGTDTAKDQIYSDISLPVGEARSLHLPLDDGICPEDVCMQLVSEVRKAQKTRKGIVFAYDNEGRRNEALDCLVYALAALYILIERFGLNLEALRQDKVQTESTSNSFAELGRRMGK